MSLTSQHTLFAWLLVLLISTTVGCAGTAYPQLINPPPVAMQQQRAEFFDPFPEVESGPGMDGARPRAYDRPAPEPVRSQVQSNRLLR